MGYNVDLAAVLRANNKQEARGRSVDFPSTGNTPERAYSFRDSLKDAVGVRRQEESKADGSKYVKKELVGRAETKLRNIKEQRPEDNKKLDSADETLKEKQNKLKKSLEEMLAKLEEMYKTQMPNGSPLQDAATLTENISKIISELSSMQSTSAEIGTPEAQTQFAGLAARLEDMLKGLNEKGGLTSKQEISAVSKEMESIISGIAKEVEAAPKAQAAEHSAEALKTADKSFKGEVIQKEAQTVEADKLQSKNSTQKTEESQRPEEDAKQPKGSQAQAVTAAASQGPKDVKQAAEETTDEIKAAVDSKVEKVTVEGKESSRQEAKSGEEAEHRSPQANKTSINHAKANEEAAAVRLEQTQFDNRIETVIGKTQVQKPEMVNKAELISQIVKKAEVILADARQEMRIQLEPENLGKLTLKLAVEKGLITAKFEAESQEVKQVIESSFNELKDMLQEKGLEVQNFSVSVGQENKGYNNSNAFQQWKETVRLNGRSLNKVSYDGYQADTAVKERAHNPYSMHDGKFDYRA